MHFLPPASLRLDPVSYPPTLTVLLDEFRVLGLGTTSYTPFAGYSYVGAFPTQGLKPAWYTLTPALAIPSHHRVLRL